MTSFFLKSLHLKITRQILWTDSQIVIEWYKSDKLLPPFISKRIQEIKKNTELEIKYIPSEINPADVGTRPACSKENKERWLNGPQFLVQSQGTWPCNADLPIGDTYSFSTGEGPTEREQSMDVDNLDVSDNIQLDISTNIQEFDPQVIKDDKRKEKQQQHGSLQGSKIQEIKNIQSEYFPLESEGKETSLSRNLGLFKDIDDILRCKGRLKNANWSFDKRYLLSLRERYWHSHKDPRVTSKLTPKLGQIVQIKGDSKNRTGWKVGKIVSLCKEIDGLCRLFLIFIH